MKPSGNCNYIILHLMPTGDLQLIYGQSCVSQKMYPSLQCIPQLIHSSDSWHVHCSGRDGFVAKAFVQGHQ
jgi:hypothetical protein